MPWLPFYAGPEDMNQVLEWLNAEDSIAFLVSAGPSRWVAVNNIEACSRPRTALWHTPSGPLPLLTPDASEADLEVEDPWASWTELRPGADPSTPYFGAGHPGVIWFNHRARENEIGLSSFEWIGNWYRVIGSAAKPESEKWWRRLGRRMKRDAVRIPRKGPVDGPNPEIWALPNALALIKSGVPRDSNP